MNNASFIMDTSNQQEKPYSTFEQEENYAISFLGNKSLLNHREEIIGKQTPPKRLCLKTKTDRPPVKPAEYKWVMRIDKCTIDCPARLNYYLESTFRKKDVQIVQFTRKEQEFFHVHVVMHCDTRNFKMEFKEKENSEVIKCDLDRLAIATGQILKLCSNWEISQTHTCQLFDLPQTGSEFKQIVELIGDSLKNVKVESIQRIQNLLLFQKYSLEKQHVIAINQEQGEPLDDIEKLLFHGTRKIPPAHIISSQDGFDPRLSASQNLWGTGAYFAETAYYAHLFSYRNQKSPNQHQILLASVLTGCTFDYGKMCNTGLKQAPIKISHGSSQDTIMRFDSVTGETKNTKVYAVYNSSKAYPRYLIKYSMLCAEVYLESHSFDNTDQIIFAN